MEFFCRANQIRNSELIVNFIIGIGIQDNIYRVPSVCSDGQEVPDPPVFWVPIVFLFSVPYVISAPFFISALPFLLLQIFL